jgi:phage terminase large subunit-like protein
MQRDETYELGDGRLYRRQKGELLHPEHEPAHVLAELKREMGPIAFSAQYQQSPIPPGGRIIQRKWLTTYDDVQPQSDDRIIMSWDIALSETESGDYSACVVLRRRGEVFYVLEVVRGRFPFDTLKQKVMEVKRRYDSATLLIEDSPISRGLIQNLRDKSINVTAYKADTDKRSRVIAQSDLFAGGARFVFPGAPPGLKSSPRNYWLFPGATMIRSTLSPRALHGVASDGANFRRDGSKGLSHNGPVRTDVSRFLTKSPHFAGIFAVLQLKARSRRFWP